jgi:hypothetical protein
MFVKQSEPESTAFNYDNALERMLALSKAKAEDATKHMENTLERAGKDSVLVSK